MLNALQIRTKMIAKPPSFNFVFMQGNTRASLDLIFVFSPILNSSQTVSLRVFKIVIKLRV